MNKSCTAVCFALFNLDPYRIKMLETVLGRLRHQSEHLHLSLGLLNEPGQSPSIPFTLLNALDQTEHIEGNPTLFQKEAIFNALVKKLPPEIENLVFLDADVFPLDLEWSKKIELKLRKFNVVQGYSLFYDLAKPGTRKVFENWDTELTHQDLVEEAQLGKSDRSLLTELSSVVFPSYAYTYYLKDCNPGAMGGCIAMKRDFFERIEGFPYEEVFGGLNDILFFYRLGLCGEAQVSSFSGALVERYQNRKMAGIRLGFTNSKLYHLWHKSGSDRDYGKRVKQAKQLEYNPDFDIQLNISGGIEYTDLGQRLIPHSQNIAKRVLNTDPVHL